MTDKTEIDPGYSQPAVLDLVQYVQSGQPLEFEKTFNQLIQARISQLVDDKKLEVADQFFGGVNTDAMSASDDDESSSEDDFDDLDDNEIDPEESEDEEEEEFVDPDEEEEEEEDGEAA